MTFCAIQGEVALSGVEKGMEKLRTALRLSLLGLVGCLLLSACSSTNSTYSSSSGSASRAPARSGFYIVHRGDTLSSIAGRFGWNWQALAAHNGIRAPYTLLPGQRIYFGSTGGATASTSRSRAPSRPVPSLIPMTRGPATSIKWSWPADGTVVTRFSAANGLNKGIDIAGQMGDPVRAAADGTVIYAGSGLRGYGELLIIKHDATFLSAYGHNSVLLVAEGQKVRKGQQIAKMGATESDRVKLHFEIRVHGKPVDPMQYLPSR